MNGTQALKLLTAGALAVFTIRAATQLLGGRGGLLTEVAGAAAGVYLASKLS